MKSLTFYIGVPVLLLFGLGFTMAQPAHEARKGLPISLGLFAESISLPTFSNIQKGGLGLKIGTEFYYRNRPRSQTFQALSVGYYYHPRVQSGLFVNTMVGYRKFIGNFFVDALGGGGIIMLRPLSPSYIRDETGIYHEAGANQFKFMPVLQMGLGFRLPNRTLCFTRYELFGEMPFRAIVLPHQAFNVGIQLSVSN